MRYHNITFPDMNNGDGLRVVLWLSGCSHKCEGCHNPQTWNVNSGIPFDKEAEKELFDALDKPYISGLTLSGGDPLHENNLQNVLNLVNKIRLLSPEKTIWLYTGYTWEQCLKHSTRKEILTKCDVLVDGEYMDSQRDITLKWRGSSNQRVIDILKTLKENKIVLHSK